MNILIVDNCETLREFCSYILNQEGHNILIADESNYVSVIESSEELIDLITINVYPANPRPAQNIFEYISSVNCNIKCILFSIPWGCDAIDEMIGKGCHHLRVPFEFEELISMVNTATPIKIMENIGTF